MSKGHGRVERLLLEALKWNRLSAKRGPLSIMGSSAKRLAEYVQAGGKPRSLCGVHGIPTTEPTRSELESVRRALRNLRKQGLVLPPTKYRHVIYRTPGKRPTSG
jgi:hypothetical protein